VEVLLRLKWTGLHANYIDIVVIKDVKGIRPFPTQPQGAVLNTTRKNSTLDLKI
jgi:hypothetical protein